MKRIIRRDTHRSRATLSVLVATFVIIALLWLGTEIVVHLLGRPALLASPEAMFSWLSELPERTLPWALIATGAAIMLIGLLVFIAAVSTARRPRRVLHSERNAIVVDDGVIASALANTARVAARVQPGQVVVSVAKNKALVSVRPTSGVPVDETTVVTTLENEIKRWNLAQQLRVQVRVEKNGAVGA